MREEGLIYKIEKSVKDILIYIKIKTFCKEKMKQKEKSDKLTNKKIFQHIQQNNNMLRCKKYLEINEEKNKSIKKKSQAYMNMKLT